MVLEKVHWHIHYLHIQSTKLPQGDILLDGESILELSADERAKKGLFLGFQYPTEVCGCGFFSFS